MNFRQTEIGEVFILDVEPKEDHRGFFARSWCQREFIDHGLNARIAQINIGFNHSEGTLRGMHYQLPPHQEAKLVRCTMGAVYDVAVDLRSTSPTYMHWIGVELAADNRRMLYIPEGCAHGYQTLAPNSEICYHTSVSYFPEAARGIRYDDPAFAIKWPLPIGCISQADLGWPDYSG